MKLSSFIDRREWTSYITPAGVLESAPAHRNEFSDADTCSLLCVADELVAKLAFLKSKRQNSWFAEEAKRVDLIQQEIAQRQATVSPMLWAAIQQEWQRFNHIWTYFPDTGPLRRELYVKHLEFFRAGLTYRRRLACCANKVGKSTTMGGFETALHAMGRYPDWWEGRRFDHPVLCWIANKSAKDTRDINERILLGPPGDSTNWGTGLLPRHLIISTTPKAGIPNGCEFIYVRHVSGGTSIIQSKSFDSGRTAFQGAPEVHVIWHDEECPKAIADESAMRTMTCGGIVMFTYTPIMGLTDLTIELFEQAGIDIGAVAVQAEENTDMERESVPEDDIMEHGYAR